MDDDLFKEDDSDITKVGKVNKDFMIFIKRLINSILAMIVVLVITVLDWQLI